MSTERTVVLATRWYFTSGITEEELTLTTVGEHVTGQRKTRHHEKGETVYEISGWHQRSTFWLAYRDSGGKYGGGSILLDEITNDRFSGMVLSKDCDMGVMQSRANMWFPASELRNNHKEGHFKFIGCLTNGQFVSIKRTEAQKQRVATLVGSSDRVGDKAPKRFSPSSLILVVLVGLVTLGVTITGLVWAAKVISSVALLVLIFTLALLIFIVLSAVVLLISGHMSEKTAAKLFGGVLGKLPGLTTWLPKTSSTKSDH